MNELIPNPQRECFPQGDTMTAYFIALIVIALVFLALGLFRKTSFPVRVASLILLALVGIPVSCSLGGPPPHDQQMEQLMLLVLMPVVGSHFGLVVRFFLEEFEAKTG